MQSYFFIRRPSWLKRPSADSGADSDTKPCTDSALFFFVAMDLTTARLEAVHASLAAVSGYNSTADYLAAREARADATLAKMYPPERFGYGKSSGSVHNEDRSPYGDKGMGKSNMDKNMGKSSNMGKGSNKGKGKDMGEKDKDMGDEGALEALSADTPNVQHIDLEERK